MLRNHAPEKSGISMIAQEKPSRAHELPCTLENTSFYEYPKTIHEAHPPRDALLVLGDLQGNPLHLVHSLLKHHIIHLPQEAYKAIAGMYARMQAYSEQSKADAKGKLCPLSAKDTQELDKIIQQTTIMTRHCNILLIGDVVCDYGHWDDLTGRLIDLLWKEGINLMILMGNHELGHLTEICTRPQEAWTFTEAYASARNTLRLARTMPSEKPTRTHSFSFGAGADGFFSQLRSAVRGKPIQQPSFDHQTFLTQRFLPNLKCLHVVIANDQQVYLFSHAPVGLEVVVVLAKRLGVHFNINTPEELIATVDRINTAYIDQVRRRIHAKDPCAFLLGPDKQSDSDYIAADFMGQVMIDPEYDPILSITQNRAVRAGQPTRVCSKDMDGDVIQIEGQSSLTICCTNLQATRKIIATVYAGAPADSFTPIPEDAENYSITTIHGHEGLTTSAIIAEQEATIAEAVDECDIECTLAAKQLALNPLHAFLPHCLSTDNGAPLVRRNAGYLTTSLPIARQCQPTLAARELGPVPIYWQAQKDLRRLFQQSFKATYPIQKLDLSIIGRHHNLIGEHAKRYRAEEDQLIKITREEQQLGFISSKRLFKMIQLMGADILKGLTQLQPSLLNHLIESTDRMNRDVFVDQWASAIDRYCKQFDIPTPLAADTDIFETLKHVDHKKLLLTAASITQASTARPAPVGRSYSA